MANVNFLNVIERDGQLPSVRFAAMTKQAGTFYKVADPGEDVHYYLEDQLISADKAEEISVLDAAGVFDGANVETVLNELYHDALEKTVFLVDESAGQSQYAKVYHFYQGEDSSDMTQNVSLGVINLPKDLVVRAGSVVAITWDAATSKLMDGDVDVTDLIVPSGETPSADYAGKYIKLEIQNQDDPIYINVKDLVDIYTGGTNAEATVAIDNNNAITVTINKVAATKIIYQAESGTQGDPDYEPEINVKDKIDQVEADLTALDEYVGDIPVTSQATTVIGYVDEKTQGGVSSLNGKAGVASKSYDNVVTIKGGVIEVEGIIQNAPNADKASTEDVYWDAAGSGKIYSDLAMTVEVTPVTTKTYIDLISGKHLNWVGNRFVEPVPDITLAKAAVTGAAEDISYDNTTSGITADDVQEAIDEIATRLTWVDV